MIMSIAACLRSSSKDLQTFGRLTAMFRLILAMRASSISLVVYPFLSSSFFSCIVLHGLVSRTRLWVFQLVEHWGVEELEIPMPILNSRNQPHDRASSWKTPVTFWYFLMWGLPRIELEWTSSLCLFRTVLTGLKFVSWDLWTVANQPLGGSLWTDFLYLTLQVSSSMYPPFGQSCWLLHCYTLLLVCSDFFFGDASHLHFVSLTFELRSWSCCVVCHLCPVGVGRLCTLIKCFLILPKLLLQQLVLLLELVQITTATRTSTSTSVPKTMPKQQQHCY